MFSCFEFIGGKAINEIASLFVNRASRQPSCAASFRSQCLSADFAWRSIIDGPLTATKEAQFVRQRVSDAARDPSLSEIGTSSALGLRHQKSTKDSNCFFPGYKENIVAVEGKARLMA